MNYWLLKSEPHAYSLDQLQADGNTEWTGVRNYLARNNLKSMENGDLCLFYHSNVGKEIVGLASVVKPYFQDPTSSDPNWVAVEIRFEEVFPKSISLAEIKAHPLLQNMVFAKSGRLSVSPVLAEEFDAIIRLSHP